ncbi:AbiJ-NTD4 domain-containing protein [Brucella anthropi]|uniref:AbiJ-NTD4 domain-containing protein n=1 Tax=Brucella anthropi TaxID=529 RepID=UPI00124C7DAE|nr:hypothetical protein [Brucella anthropi]KAB2781196.1 hypothetical protein F9K99_08270 [Brucella anthropi]
MLHDIFARRYEDTPLRDSFEQRDSRLLVQAFRILAEDMYPYYQNGKKDDYGAAFWAGLQNSLSRELGLKELSPLWIGSYQNIMVQVCENWMLQPVNGSPDIHIKERLSLIELGFRTRGNEIAAMNAAPISSAEQTLSALTHRGPRLPGSLEDGVRARRKQRTDAYRTCVDELNTRFLQARYPLNYHNGFIQISTDDLVQQEVETPFWSLISSKKWENVDTDMKEALDRRDSNGRDPAFYAARALESTIKIISDSKKLTHGKEKGAHNYIENLASKANSFILPWEGECLKHFFTNVRNPFGHGAGSAEMPSLSPAQTAWAIEFSMSWIKSLIARL